MSMPSTGLPATPTISPTARRWPPRTSCAGSTAWRRSWMGLPGTRPAAIRRPPRRCARASPPPALTAQHCHDVLRAFRQDAVKLRYRDWDDLMEYCRYSAAPVGRQLLRSARRKPRHLAGLRRAVLGLAGAQPSAGLRRRLPRPRPGLPAARRSRRGRLPGRNAGGAGGEPGIAAGAGHRCSTAPTR